MCSKPNRSISGKRSQALTWLRGHLRVPVAALLITTLGLWTPQARATTYTWTQTTANTYSFIDAVNWTPAGFPNAIGDVINLNSALGGAQTINLNRNITAGTLNIGDTTTTNAFTLASGGGAGYLNFDVSSGSAGITKALGANANDIISAPIIFRDDLVINNNSASGSLTISGTVRSPMSNLTLGGTGALAAGSIDVTGIISSTGSLTKADAGTARLTAANTYSGATQVSGGTLILNNTAALPIRSAVTIDSGATVDAQLALTIGSLSGAGLLTNSTGTARLLTIGRDDTSTTFTGRIAPATALNIQITKIGAGTLTLQPQGAVNAGTWTGATIINGGTLALDTSASSLTSAFMANPTLQLAGGNFQMIGRSGATVAQTVGNFTLGATGGKITLTPNGGTATNLTLGTLTATTSGGSLLVESPSGTALKLTTTTIASTALNGRLVFTDGTANTYNWAYNNGSAANNISGFTPVTALVATGGAPGTPYILTAAGGTTLQSGATTIGTLKLTGSGTQNLDLSTFNMQLGGGTTSTPGAILIDGTANWNINGSGFLVANTPGTSPDLIFQHYGTGTVTVNAGIGNAAAGALVKAGPGSLVLAGTTSYTGVTFVDGGTLSFNNTGASGSGTLGTGIAQVVQIRDGATLQYTGATGTIAASTTANSHTFLLPGGQATFEVSTSGAILSISGAISGAGGLTKTGAGTLQYSGSNSYTGPTIINAGTLLGSGVGFIADTSPVIIGPSGTLDTNGTAANQTEGIGSLSGSGTIQNSGSSSKGLTVGNDNTNTTFSGTFSGAGGNTFTKQGTGIQTLSGTMNWTGGKNVYGGVLRFGVNNAFNGTGTLTIANSGAVSTLDLAGFNYATAAITFGGSSSTATAQGNILIGTGTLTLGGDITYDGTNGVPGLGAVITGSSPGGIALSASRILAIANSANVGPDDYELTISAPISGTGFGLTKNNLGNLLLSGNVSATGAFVMNAGGLTLDYTTDNNSKLTTGAFSLLGGNVVLNGNASADTLQSVASTTFAAGGSPLVTINPGSGQEIALSIGALTRAASAGTVRFILPSGTQSATNGLLTTTANDAVTGLVGAGGGWLTVTSGGATNFATVSSGNVIPVTPTTQDTITSWGLGQNITDSAGFSGTLDSETSINSLRFNSSSPSAVNIAAGGILRIESGGILQTAAATGTTSISGGRLVPNVGNELIFTTLSGSSTLNVSSSTTGATAITKTGNGILRLSGYSNATGIVTPQNGTLEITGGFALGDTAAVTIPGVGGNNVTLSLLAGQTETIGSLSGGSTSHNTSTVIINAGANLTINQGTAGTYLGALTGTGTLTKIGSTELTYGANAAATFTGPTVINAGSLRLAGNNIGTIGSTVISVSNPGSQLHINHDNNNTPDRVPNAAVITLNNTAPGLGLSMRTTHDSSRAETVGTLALGAGHNVVLTDATAATRFSTLTFGAASGANVTRANNATTLVVGRNLGGVAYTGTGPGGGAIAAPTIGGRITFTNAITGTLDAVGGGGADGTATGSIFPYMIGQATAAAPAATDVGNSFVRSSANGLRPLSTVAANGEYIFEVAGYNGLADSTANNLRFTATGTVAASTGGTKTINALAIDSTAGAVTLTGTGADTLALASGAFLSTGTAANNTSLTGYAGITTATNNEYVMFVTNNQFTLGSPLTTAAASLTKSGAGAMIMNGLTGNAYTGGTFFNQGLIEASALSNLGPSGGLNFYGGGLRWATGTTFDISVRTVTIGAGGAVLDTNGNNVTLAAAIGNGGVGGLTKAGLGNLTLNAALNLTTSTTYVAPTVISGGRLITDTGNDRLPIGAALTMSGTSALQLGSTTASNQTVSELVGVATSSIVGGNGSVSTLTVNQNTNTTYAGIFGGAGTNENNLAIVKSGLGTLTLGATASTFTGGITIRSGQITGGNLATTFGAGTITIGDSSGSLDATLAAVNSFTYTNPIVIASGNTGAATIIAGTTTGNVNFSGGITLPSSPNSHDVLLSRQGTTNTGTFSGGITGNGNVIIDNFATTTGAIVLSGTAVNNVGSIKNAGINGTGATTISADIGSNVTNLIQDSATSNLTLSGTSILYTGTTTVNQGILNVTGSAGAAMVTTGVTVAGGATFNTVNTVGQSVNLGSGPLNLGAGTGTTTLGLELGSTTAYDQYVTTAAASTTNAVRFNLTGLTGFGAGTYNLLQASGGLAGATYSLGTLTGSLSGITLNLAPSATSVDLLAVASTGDFFWKGAFGTSWMGLSGLSTNWATTLAGTQGTIDVNGTPGIGSSVIFSANGLTGTSLSTTLDAQFSVKDLTFNNAVGSGPLASVTISTGVAGSNLKITPSSSSDGINVQTGAPAAITISAPVLLGADQSWTVTDAATVLNVSGGVTGNGFVLNKEGSGILQLTTANLATYDGQTNINGGTLRAGSATALSANSTYNVGAAGTLSINGFNNTIGALSGAVGAVVNNNTATGVTLTAGGNNASTTYAGTIVNGSTAVLAFTKTGTGALTLSGANTYTGNTAINGGTLNITGGYTGSTTASVLTYGAATAVNTIVNVSSNMDLFQTRGATTSGAVAVYNQTAGTVNVTPGNTSSQHYVANGAGSYGFFNLTGGTYKINGGVGNGRWSTNGTTNLATPSVGVVYIGGTGFLDHTNAEWFINGYSHGQITVAGGGSIDHTGSNNPFAIFMDSTVAASNYGVLNVAGGSVTVGAQSIKFGNSATNGTGNTGFINLAGGTLSVGSALTSSVNTGNNAYLNFAGGTLKTSANVTAFIPASSSAITYTSTIFGAITNSSLSGAPDFTGGLTVDTTGANTMTLTNVLSGATGAGITQGDMTVTGGTGYIGSPEVIFSSAGLVPGGTPAAGYALISGGAVTGIVITSPGTYTTGTTPTVTLNGGGGTGASISIAQLNTANNVSGGLTKIGTGTLTLSGANTYTGGTNVNLGTLALGATNTLASTGAVTINGGTLDLPATFTNSVGVVTLQTGSITGAGSIASSANFELQSGTVSGVLAGTTGINKTTGGSVTLSGVNTFSGPVNANGGTLSFATSANLGDASATNTLSANGGTLSYTGSGSLDLTATRVLKLNASGGTLDVPSTTGVLTVSGGIDATSTGSLTKSGAGTVVIPGTSSWTASGNNVTVNDGTLRAGFGTGGIGNLTVGGTGNMDFRNTATQILTLGGALNLSNGATLGFELGLGDASPLISLNDQIISTVAGTVAGNITLNFFNLAGFSAGSYNLLSAPSGLLSGGVDYLLGTAPAGFNYTINKSDTLISLDVVSFVPRYWTNSEGTNSWATANGAGPFTTNFSTDAAGTLNYGLTPQNADTVIFSATSVAGPTVSTTLDGSYSVDGVQFIAGAGTVTSTTIAQGSTGTLTIRPSSTSSGIVVGANAGASILTAPVVASNALVASQTWNVDGSGANGSSLNISGNVTFDANVVKNGAGMLTLSGTNSGNGNFTLSAGTLNINSPTALGSSTGIFSIAPGVTINNTLGSAVVMTTNKPMTWNSFTFSGSNNLNLGAGAVTLALNTTVTTTAGTLTAGGTVGDGGNNRSLTKDGAGTLAVGGAVVIGGNLTVSAGTGTFSGTTNTIGGSVTASGTSFTMSGDSAITGAVSVTAGNAALNGNNTLGNGVSVSGGTVTMNGANTVTGSVAVTGGSLSLGGANSISGGASLTTGTLTLGGANTIGTGVTVNSGTLNLANAGALGTNAFTINGGTIDNTFGSALTLTTNNPQTWAGSYTFTGSNNLNLGAGAVTLTASPTITTAANTLTVGGIIDDGASTFGITKTGTGTLILGASNTYNGATVINQGTVAFNAVQNLSSNTNGLTFGSAAGNTTVGKLDLTNANATFGGTLLVQTNNSAATAATNNNIVVPSGGTLTNTGAVTAGSSSSTGTPTTRLFLTGGGTWNVTAPAATFRVGGGNSVNSTNSLDMTGLSTFTASLTTGAFRVGSSDGGSVTSTDSVLLAPTSTITAGTIDVGSNTTHSGSHTLSLGTGVTTFNADTISVGSQETSTGARRGNGTINFQSGTLGSLIIRASNGTGAATMNIMNSTAATAQGITSTVSLAGHSVDALLGTLTIASRGGATVTTQSNVGTLTFDTGTLIATTTNLSIRAGSTFTTANVTGNLTIGGTTAGTIATLGTVSMSQNSVSTATSSGNAISTIDVSGIGSINMTTLNMGTSTVSGASATSGTQATLNLGGTATTTIGTLNMAVNSATVAVTGATTATSTINLSGGALSVTGNIVMANTTANALNVATSNINITGGTLSVGGNISVTNGVGTENTTITLNGGTLDMTAGNIGASGNLISSFNLQTGTLQNLTQFNNGAALVKSTSGILTLSGTNAYTGDTSFASGGGTIRLGSGTAIPDGSGKGNLVTTDGTVDMNGFSDTVNGLTGTGIVDNLLTATTGTLTVGGNNVSSSFGGAIQNTVGTVALAKTGTGTQTFTTANTFSGGTTIAGGIIQVDNGGALGSGAVSFAGSGVRLQVAGGQTLSNPITIGTNSSAASRGMIEASGTGTATISGPIAINNGAVGGGHFAGVAGNTLVISGAITAFVPVVHRLGTVIYSGGGTYSNFTIGQDTVQLGANDGLSTAANLLIGSSAAGNLDLAGFNQSLAAITKGGSAATIGNSSTTTDSTLTITGTSSYAGTIQNTHGAGTMKTNLGVNGGALTLTAANTYMGATTINSGSLALTVNGAIGSTSAVNLTGTSPSFNISGITATSTTIGSLAGDAGSTVSLGNKILLTGGNDASTTFAGDSSGTGGLTKQGTGTMALSGSNTYSGPTLVSAGTLQLGNGSTTGSLATTSAISISSGAVFAINQSGIVTQGTDFSSSALTGAGGFAQVGTGRTILTLANGYSGPTTVSAGILQVGNGSTGLLTGTGDVTVFKAGSTLGSDAPILSGSGTIAGASVIGEASNTANRGVIAPGTTGTPESSNQTLIFTAVTAPLTVAGGSQMQLSITTPTQSAVSAIIAALSANTFGDASSYIAVNSPVWTAGAPSSVGNYDFINLTAGSLSLGSRNGGFGNGTVSIVDNGYLTSAQLGDVFNLLDWVGLLTVGFNAGSGPTTGGVQGDLDLPTLTGGLAWDTSAFASHGVVVIVPEPSRALMLLFGALLLGLRRRRK